MDYALRSLQNKNVFRCCLNVSNFSSGRRSPGGRLFHTRGLAPWSSCRQNCYESLVPAAFSCRWSSTGVSDGQHPTGGDSHRRSMRALLQQKTGASAPQSWKRLAYELAASAVDVDLQQNWIHLNTYIIFAAPFVDGILAWQIHKAVFLIIWKCLVVFYDTDELCARNKLQK